MNNMKTGVMVCVKDENGVEHTGCFYCPHSKDTGHSWVCGLTGEKLEGFDTAEDKRADNTANFLSRNILKGVGELCPLCKIIKERMTTIKLDITLEELEVFIEDTSFSVRSELTEEEDGLEVFVTWYDDGYESNEDAMRDELETVLLNIRNRFNVVITEVEEEWRDDMETVMVTLP